MNKVAIIEKNLNIRNGIKILINRFSQLECKYTFSELSHLKEKFEEINPDIILLELETKNKETINEINHLKSLFPNLIIILLILNEESELIFEALLNGATTYVHKNAPAVKMVKVLEDATDKKMTINTIIARKIEKYICERNVENLLEGRELLLLKKITEGNSLLAIEKTYNITHEEIKASFWNIFNQLFWHRLKAS